MHWHEKQLESRWIICRSIVRLVHTFDVIGYCTSNSKNIFYVWMPLLLHFRNVKSEFVCNEILWQDHIAWCQCSNRIIVILSLSEKRRTQQRTLWFYIFVFSPIRYMQIYAHIFIPLLVRSCMFYLLDQCIRETPSYANNFWLHEINSSSCNDRAVYIFFVNSINLQSKYFLYVCNNLQSTKYSKNLLRFREPWD